MAKTYKVSEETAAYLRRARKAEESQNARNGDTGGNAQSMPPLRVKVTGNAAGGGKYTGVIWLPPSDDISASGNLSASELGTEGRECLICNLVEQGTGFHTLASGRVCSGSLLRINTDGKPVVEVEATAAVDCDE